jgi:hypothetical protein
MHHLPTTFGSDAYRARKLVDEIDGKDVGPPS